ncbi:IS256 family transposase [Acidithiobacillus sp. CV18-2]|nr:IS256 family transposase [Acidithiobacillus sp. CV18-3]MBU2757980.1 IS256 family transposase [Acidithiobacillus sp. BN09-2]MBU2776646.1 IS256 family transposase [Acidithiobacillus sp. CV18-2]MBU2798659.1 IS256 family transposase [Acidithiobacillus sp. VAN18-4]UTV82056.1 IS256 family transposase [Acidithiobacillus sp. YTS05]
MREDSKVVEGLAGLEMGIEEILRQGARRLVQQAVEAELAAVLEELSTVRTVDGRRAVVRNGYQPEREILTRLGPVPVGVPKTRDRSRSCLRVRSSLVPPYVRRTQTIAAALPWLYLHGISSGKLREALVVLLGEQARGLSPAALGRLKAEWAQEHAEWQHRSLCGKRYAYWWADGIYTNLRAEDDPRICLLVIIGVISEGKKEIVAVTDGLRESKVSWLEVLRDLRDRGVQEAPLLAIGDGALGFWSALSEIYPQIRHQRCWVHKTANVLNEFPKRLQSQAKAALQNIWMAETKEAAEQAWRVFVRNYQVKYPKAVEKLQKDRDVLLTFYDFPAEHWLHIRSSNAIESTFATVRQRSSRTKNCVSRSSFLGLSFKLIQQAEKHWKGIRHPQRLRDLFAGVIFVDGIPANETQPDSQQDAA